MRTFQLIIKHIADRSCTNTPINMRCILANYIRYTYIKLLIYTDQKYIKVTKLYLAIDMAHRSS